VLLHRVQRAACGGSAPRWEFSARVSCPWLLLPAAFIVQVDVKTLFEVRLALRGAGGLKPRFM
jgi:hypothetical protein